VEVSVTGDNDNKARILLVDDSKLMRAAAQKMLSSEFDIVTAENGEDAWATLHADASINVVFTDLSMPVLDGYGLLDKIRRADDAGVQEMPVIVVTGAENDEAARAQALDQGATDFITKPFNSTDLLARARAHANYQRIKKQLQDQSTVDLLTGLSNKSGFIDRLQQDLAFTARHQQPLTVVRIDIDDFKTLFLQHGRAVADKIVAHVACLIRSRVRTEDTAGRLGLASFALSLPTSAQDGGRRLAERIRTELAAAQLQVGGKPVAVRASAGVLTLERQSGLAAAAVLQQCQQVLEAALKAGGDRVLGDQELVSSDTETDSVAGVPRTPLRIDELLRQVEAGDTRAVIEQLPLALDRLLPLLQLLDDRQRARLIRFLRPASSTAPAR
jgi:two-component system cell cycle response regulator